MPSRRKEQAAAKAEKRERTLSAKGGRDGSGRRDPTARRSSRGGSRRRTRRLGGPPREKSRGHPEDCEEGERTVPSASPRRGRQRRRRRSPRGNSGSIEPPAPSEAEGTPLLRRGEADEELATLEAQMSFESAQSLDAGKAAAELPRQQRLPPDAHHVRQSLLGHSQRHPSRPESGTQVLFQEHHLRLCAFSTAW